MVSPSLSTEVTETRYRGLDTWEDAAILTALLEGHQRALAAVAAAIPDLEKAASIAADRLRDGGRLIYIAAGSPALMSLADALEIPQTYGIPHERIILILADGDGIARRLNGSREDSAEGAISDVAAHHVTTRDCVIATSASGTTRYTVAGLIAARDAGAATIGIAGNAGSPLLDAADVAVLLATGPEVISGSTRMGAGTAQKAALNMLSTLMGLRLGHVHDGLMVNMKADNDKLRDRAARMIVQITGVDMARAKLSLDAAQGEVKPAVLIASGMDRLTEAQDLLYRVDGNLRQALAALDSQTTASGPTFG
jgi:N-acetylmuramic acid 6-phosphate etherase